MQKKKPLPKRTPTGPNQVNGTTSSTSSQPASNGVAKGSSVTQDGNPTVKDYDDFPITVTRSELAEGLRYHAIKFVPKQDPTGQMIIVDPYDETRFIRPVRLHRRAPRDKQIEAEHSDAASGMDDKERELMTARRAERQAEREANRALIAPTGNEQPQKKRKQGTKGGVSTAYYNENDPVQAKRMKLRIEETRPWHLEDFENKSVWVGSYEEPLSEQNIMLEVMQDGTFRMVPVEKWYRFAPTNKVTTMNMDQVDKHMNKKFKLPRWFMKTQDDSEDARRLAFQARQTKARQESRGGDDNERNFMEDGPAFNADRDEIDFEFNDEFQDDDEGLIFGDDVDEAKEVEKRVRDEMREANLPATGIKDEDKDWDAEEDKQKEAERDERKRAKKLRKRLIKRERKFEYDSDSDHPYSDSSETEDSEEERERLEEERKRDEAKKLEQASGDRSGASTKGTTTPTARSEKRDLSRPSSTLGGSLKRPGSPNLSDASGNESSRKKAKIGSQTNAASGARSLSPEAANRIPRHGGSGSGSDTEASRAGKPRIRLKASPPGSRSGSPAGSRSGSPAPGSGARSPPRAATFAGSFPTREEIRAAIPAAGMATNAFTGMFKGRLNIKDRDHIQKLSRIIKEVAAKGPDGLWRRREENEKPAA